MPTIMDRSSLKIEVDERLTEKQLSALNQILGNSCGLIRSEQGAVHYYPDRFHYFTGEGRCLLITRNQTTPSIQLLSLLGKKWEEKVVGDCYGLEVGLERIAGRVLNLDKLTVQYNFEINWGGEGQIIRSIAFYGANRSGFAEPGEIALWFRDPRNRPREVFYEYHSIDFIVLELLNGRRTFILADDAQTLLFEINVETSVDAFIDRIGRGVMEVQHLATHP